MRDETIAGFITRLAARTGAPGGGATGALHAAQAAALLAMVARYSDGPRNDGEVVGRVRRRRTAWRARRSISRRPTRRRSRRS